MLPAVIKRILAGEFNTSSFLVEKWKCLWSLVFRLLVLKRIKERISGQSTEPNISFRKYLVRKSERRSDSIILRKFKTFIRVPRTGLLNLKAMKRKKLFWTDSRVRFCSQSIICPDGVAAHSRLERCRGFLRERDLTRYVYNKPRVTKKFTLLIMISVRVKKNVI